MVELICLALFIFQIVILVKAIKKKEKKYWIGDFCLEIFTVLLTLAMLYYYDNLAPRGGFMPGLDYLGQELACMGILILSFVMFCITIIAGIIVFEKIRKAEGKKSANPLRLITAAALIVIGIVCLFTETKDNFGKIATTGTVIGYDAVKNGPDYEYWPIIEFSVNGVIHQDHYPARDLEIGDILDIYYLIYDDYRVSLFYSNYKPVYIPAFIIGLLIIFFRFKKDKISDTTDNP